MSWEADKNWADRFLVEIKRILGEYLIDEPCEKEDAEHNTDLVVLKIEPIRVACRVRHHAYLRRYGDEFTIRATRPNGRRTELAKIVAGWGDFFFYGFADEAEAELASWCLCNLKVFRLWFNSYIATHSGQLPGLLCHNDDRSSSFYSYRFGALPNSFVVARKDLVHA